jgi:hypothetical protein
MRAPYQTPDSPTAAVTPVNEWPPLLRYRWMPALPQTSRSGKPSPL